MAEIQVQRSAQEALAWRGVNTPIQMVQRVDGAERCHQRIMVGADMDITNAFAFGLYATFGVAAAVIIIGLLAAIGTVIVGAIAGLLTK